MTSLISQLVNSVNWTRTSLLCRPAWQNGHPEDTFPGSTVHLDGVLHFKPELLNDEYTHQDSKTSPSWSPLSVIVGIIPLAIVGPKLIHFKISLVFLL